MHLLMVDAARCQLCCTTCRTDCPWTVGTSVECERTSRAMHDANLHVSTQGGDVSMPEVAAPQSRRNEKRSGRGGRGGPDEAPAEARGEGPQNTRKRRAVRPPEAGAAAPLSPKHAGMPRRPAGTRCGSGSPAGLIRAQRLASAPPVGRGKKPTGCQFQATAASSGLARGHRGPLAVQSDLDLQALCAVGACGSHIFCGGVLQTACRAAPAPGMTTGATSQSVSRAARKRSWRPL